MYAPAMDLWLMIRIFLVVLAWGGLLLLAGYALEMLSGSLSRSRGGGAGAASPPARPAAPDDTSGTPAAS